MKAVVFTLGCKVNEVESASIMATLEDMGFEVSDSLCPADIFIINTCAVTKEAEKKSRQAVARVRKLNPYADIYICGCASEKDAAVFTQRGVNFVCGARNKDSLISAIATAYSKSNLSLLFPKQTKTRAFIKIEDGCNNFCSYCIIPYLRGREISRSIEDIAGEIEKITSPEVVLNGINISAYNDNGRTLKDLISALNGVEKRIRLGSLECTVITEDFLTALKGLKDFAPQFHLSLQSGSTAVLKAMNRHYTREEYLEKCELIYKYFPDAAITCDIIAGFPTETEEDFEKSLTVIEEAKFARVHAFAFSPREGTVAYKMKDVPADVKYDRMHRLLQAANCASLRYITGCIGKNYELIAEEQVGKYFTGYTQNYIKVYIEASLCAGKKYTVKLKEAYLDGALAELV